MNRRVLINLVAFSGVFALMLVWAVNNVVTIESLENPYPIKAEFPQASGVLPRAEVAYLGVHYGSVDEVERIDGGVRMTLNIDRDKKIPAGSTANIFRKSAIGEPYIDFFPPEDYDSDEGPFIEEGDLIPMEQTTVPLEFSELLRVASELVSGIDPDRVAVLIHELALALDGREDDLRQLAIAGDQLSATFAERTELLDRLATNNTRLTHTVTEHRASLGQSITDLRLVAESLENAKGDTSVLLERGALLLTQTADLVASQKGNLDCILGDLEAFIDMSTTQEQLNGLRTLLTVGPRAFGEVFSTRDIHEDGVWVRVGNISNPNNPPPQYVPARDTPGVPAVGPCASTLEPAHIDFERASSTQDASPATLGAVMLLVLLVAGAVVRGSLPARDG